MTDITTAARPRSIYLAARYSRRLELCFYRAELALYGIQVTSRWLDGNHQLDDTGVPIGDNGERLFETSDTAVPKWRRWFAEHDRDDVATADMLIAFTEQPRSRSSRGGRHVELGLALGTGKRVAVIGPRENVFCWLPEIEHYDAWTDFLVSVAPEAADTLSPGGWGCDGCGAAWFGSPLDDGLCQACQENG